MENSKIPLKIAIVLFLFIGIMMIQAFNGEDLNNICTTNNSILFNNGTLWGCIDFTYLLNFNLPLWEKTVNYTNNTYIFNGNIDATGTINAVENFSINGVKGITANYTINGSCILRFNGGLLTSSTC